MVNILCSALWQQLRQPSSWVPIAALLITFTTLRIVLQVFGLMSPQTDESMLGDLWNPMVVAGGLWLATRKEGTFVSAFAGALAAATIGKIPGIVLASLAQPSHLMMGGAVFLLYVVRTAAIMAALGASCGMMIRRIRGRSVAR